MFTKIEDAAALLFSKGKFTVHDLYTITNTLINPSPLYARDGKHYMILSKGGETTKHGTTWQHIEGVDYTSGLYGRLVLAPKPEPTPKGKKRAA